jgi:hypothetical protein
MDLSRGLGDVYKRQRLKDTDNKDFWLPILNQKSFQKWIENNYQISTGSIISSEDDISKELDALDDLGEEDA